jgi:aminobenzoyl-glutamate utilization protein B
MSNPIASFLDGQMERFSDFNQQIYGYAEPAWREYRASSAYCDVLEAEGFDVERGSAGIPTAFVASWGETGPVIASYAEYDAVPGFNQATASQRAAREGMHPLAPGDPDPHSAQGTTGLAALLATKAAMEERGLAGTLRFFGQPAEKMNGAKVFHAAKGYFDGLDAVVAYHPEFTNTVQGALQSAAYFNCVFTFVCDDVAPKLQGDGVLDEPQIATRNPGALDAVVLMYSITKATYDQFLPRTAGWNLTENILHASQATADNLASGVGHIQYAMRAPEIEPLEIVYARLAENARLAARATGCTAHVRWVSKTRVGLYNEPLTHAAFASLQQVGVPAPGPAAIAFAQELQRTLGHEPDTDPFLEDGRRIVDPAERDEEWWSQLPRWQKHFTWDDYTEFTWHAPTARIFTAKPLLRQHRSWSHWSGHALNGVREAIDPTWRTGAEAIGLTMLRLLEDGELRRRAWADFKERTGGGIGGSEWVAPLLAPDVEAPVDLPWPEYVTTPRGHGWRLPWPCDYGEVL